jgi:barstar (barnase inhibitor)
MSKLLQRLSDASKSGVYRVASAEATLEALQGGGPRLTRIVLPRGAGKAQILEQLARALEFPSWFGGNWDALEDCLTDLSWSKAPGHVLLVEGAADAVKDDLGVLEDLLASAAAQWAERGRPFFAVFVGGSDSLPALHREPK